MSYKSRTYFTNPSIERMENNRIDLEAWLKNQPISILQLEPSDRIVLMVAGKRIVIITNSLIDKSEIRDIFKISKNSCIIGILERRKFRFINEILLPMTIIKTKK